MRACLQRMDFMQISTIASLHSIEASMPDKTVETVETRRPWRGSPRPCVLAGAFLRFMA